MGGYASANATAGTRKMLNRVGKFGSSNVTADSRLLTLDSRLYGFRFALRGIQREPADEDRAGSFAFAVNGDRPALQLDEPLDQVQTEANPGHIASRRRIALPEHVEDMGQEVFRDAAPGVGNPDFELSIDNRAAGRHGATCRRELHRVREQVPEHLPEPMRVGKDRGVLVDRPEL